MKGKQCKTIQLKNHQYNGDVYTDQGNLTVGVRQTDTGKYKSFSKINMKFWVRGGELFL